MRAGWVRREKGTPASFVRTWLVLWSPTPLCDAETLARCKLGSQPHCFVLLYPSPTSTKPDSVYWLQTATFGAPKKQRQLAHCLRLDGSEPSGSKVKLVLGWDSEEELTDIEATLSKVFGGGQT
eukprot:COSAG01_NODE_16982_length_1188_cov_1.883379_1_plen_124_part_00